MTLRWKCESKGCYLKQLPNWGMLDDCFPGRISVSDIDGVVEIGGRFLFLEWKRPRVALTTGQRIMFQNMVKTGVITVFLINGDPETSTPEQIVIFGRKGAAHPEPCDCVKLQQLCAKWAKWAKRPNG